MRKKSRKNNGILSNIIVILTLIMLSFGVFKVVDINLEVYKKDIKIEHVKDQVIINNEVPPIEEIKANSSGYLSLEEDPNADDAKVIENMLNTWDYLREDGKRVAYLTFDDGPSKHVTSEVLDVLKANDVKATFFVLGSMVEKSHDAKIALKRMVSEGHSIGNHGYCHRYEILYPGRIANASSFMADMKKSEEVMKSVLGKDFHTRVIRFPGGHSSWDTNELDIVLEEEGYAYIDWNTLNGDAEGHNLSPVHLVNRLQETVMDLYGNDDVLVILMHDTDAKEGTAKSLQGIIDYLKDSGYEFRTLK